MRLTDARAGETANIANTPGRQIAIKRARLWTARIVNINFGAGDEFSKPRIRPREKLNRALKGAESRTDRQIFRERAESRFSLLFLFPRREKGSILAGEIIPFSNPSTPAHQDSAFKLVKSTTRRRREHADTRRNLPLPSSVGCRVESAMENRDRATVPDIKGCRSPPLLIPRSGVKICIESESGRAVHERNGGMKNPGERK